MPQTTIFHITHQKAGSQWVREILKYSAPDRFISQETDNHQLTHNPIKPGKIYAAVYMPYNEFNSLFTKITNPNCRMNWVNFCVKKQPIRTFTIIRDLRDTLVSLYFSRCYSHPILKKEQQELRLFLNENTLEIGMLKLMNTELAHLAKIQSSWANKSELLIRYEDLLSDAHSWFERIIHHCEIQIGIKKLITIIENNQFQNSTGRKPGIEDRSSHLRKGIAGDWRNYFTQTVKCDFKRKFGDLLINTGYEKDKSW